jgi:hypothetical protein
MSELATHIVESIIGAPAFVTGGLLLLYALYRMARHEILLFGNVCSDSQGEDVPRFKYSFFIQNIEEVSFPIPLRVNIRDRRTSADDIEPLEVKVYAGPKHVVGGSSLSCTQHKTSVRESFFVFERLPPFDTWRLDCETESTWVELEIDTGDENRLIRKRLIVDLYPRRLALQAGHASSTAFKGTVMTPGIGILFLIILAVELIYLGSIGLINSTRETLHLVDFAFRPIPDCSVAAALLIFLWIGYRRIQRPVYPIMQGYLFATHIQHFMPCSDDSPKQDP